ncbi:AraC family transcriptional regulator [Lacticaseibacillus kribbianus]|uniref:AraC family transcriptional regulator n=1 Tax=Lacticaseibacillus kribbianus TaxID=2926292 RepID=UPI001CD7A16A|nr:AraC family transcriptional regulator [Lacticaseibacillus kribbianus]
MSTTHENPRIYDFSNTNRTFNLDVNVYTCGSEACEPDHAYGPTVRSGYMIYFVLNGEGTYTVRNRQYHLGPKQGFLIEPHTLITFQADHNKPWTYLWIGFSGQSAAKYIAGTCLSSAAPLFDFEFNSAILRAANGVIEGSNHQENRNLIMTGRLFEFLYRLATDYPNRRATTTMSHRELVEYALFYISQNYSEPITVGSLAAVMHIDRTYLHRLFTKRVGRSPQAYIKKYRMDQASQLLRETDYPIQVVARAVGYENQFSFSKAFSSLNGESPTAYRARHVQK